MTVISKMGGFTTTVLLSIVCAITAVDLGGIEGPVTAEFCVRTFSNYGDEGCRSLTDGPADGVLYEVHSSKDVYSAINFGEPVAILASSTIYTNDILTVLEQSRHVVGLIIYDDANTYRKVYGGAYSTDQENVSPFGGSSDAVQRTWNTYGNGIMRRSLSIPIVHIGGESVAEIKRLCSENHRNGFHSGAFVHIASFNVYMGGEGITSKACLNWKDIYGNKNPKCLPIGGLSVWATAGVLDDRDKVVATASMDGVAEFHDLSNAANDAASSIAALLIAAESLGRIDQNILRNLPRQILFFLPDADEWGAAGSRRFVEDLQSFHCEFKLNDTQTMTGLPACTDPVYTSLMFEHLKLTQIRSLLAVDQIALTEYDVMLQQALEYENGGHIDTGYAYDNTTSTVYIRTASSSASSCNYGDDGRKDNSNDDYDEGDGITTSVEDIISAVADIDGLNIVKATAIEVPNDKCEFDILPPTPIATILEAVNALSSVSSAAADDDRGGSNGNKKAKAEGYLLTGYDTQFINPRYHTRLDVGTAINTAHIHRVALALSRYLLLSAGGDADGIAALSINTAWANEVISCLLYNWGCAMMDQYTAAESDDIESVAGGGSVQQANQDGASTVGIQDDGSDDLPSYYSGVFGTASGGGQPVVKVIGTKGQGDLFTKYSKSDWDPKVNKLFVVPNKLQAFIRNVLLYHLGTREDSTDSTTASSPEDADSEIGGSTANFTATTTGSTEQQMPCVTSADCGKCAIPTYGYMNVSMQCVLSECFCPSAFYHIALDPGLQPEAKPGFFEMIDETAPCYTEPYWQTLSFTIYTSSSNRTNYIMFCIGLVVACFSAATAWYMQRYLLKKKLL